MQIWRACVVHPCEPLGEAVSCLCDSCATCRLCLSSPALWRRRWQLNCHHASRNQASASAKAQLPTNARSSRLSALLRSPQLQQHLLLLPCLRPQQLTPHPAQAQRARTSQDPLVSSKLSTTQAASSTLHQLPRAAPV